MGRLELELVDRRLPGAAPVADHSVFSGLAAARPAEATIQAAVPRSGAVPPRVSLRGSWSRHVATEDALLDVLPGADARWHPVRVPNNYGLEPALSAHFGPVFYRRRLPSLSAERVRLELEAVDYLCDVWIDDRHLGHHEGYFAPFEFDVSSSLRDGAMLTVGVQDPFEDLDPAEPFVRHAKRVVKGTLKYHDSRPGGLPGRHTPGWDPRVGQSLTTGGIVGDVRLVGTGIVRVAAVFVTPLDHRDGRAHVAVIADNGGAPTPLDLAIRVGSPDETEVSAALTVRAPSGSRHHGSAPSAGTLSAALTVRAPSGPFRVDFELRLPDCRAWWPCSHDELGSPYLYTLAVDALVESKVSDAAETRFGFRTARLDDEPKRLLVNERPIFVRAANYIPRQHFADVGVDFYRRDIEMCMDAHLNSLGVHGHLQCRACYEAADEAGMLVFQDFPLQWHYDSGSKTNPGFIDLACRQIAEMAYTFYNHPSVVYWACHNEPTALFVPGMKPDAENDFDNQVLDEALERRLREVDPVRHVHRASGIGDDLHLYDGSLTGGVVYGVRDHRTWFVSEYGFWTAGTQAHRWGDVRWPPDEDLMREWLSRLSFGPWTFSFSGLPKRYESMKAWAAATEAYGAYLAKYQTEWIRMHRGDPFYAYRWHFFSDWWGWAGGGLVDVDRRPKATYAALKSASRPVLVCTSLANTVFEPGAELAFEIFAINDTMSEVELDVVWSWHLGGDSLVVGADDAVGDEFELHQVATSRSMVAMPRQGPLGPPADIDGVERSGRISATVAPESTVRIAGLALEAPERHLEGGTLELWWGHGERNWFHVLAADRDWFCGPGAFVVSSGAVSRLR